MALEPVLRVSGRILAAVFIPAALALTLLLFAGSALVRGVFSVPHTAIALLEADNFHRQIAPAVLTAALDSLPGQLTVGGMPVNIAPLVAALRQADIAQLAQQIVPREWVQQQIVSAIVSALSGAGAQAETSARDRAALIRYQLTGDRAARLANLLLETARACTQSEISRLRLLHSVRRDGLSALAAVDFVCAPPAGDELRGVMRDVIVVALAHVADGFTADLASYAASVDLSGFGIDTPAGRISLAWPGVQLAAGSFTLVYSLPADVRAPVEEAAQRLRSALQTVNERVTSEIEQSQQNLENLRPPAAGEQTPVPTLTPAPTASPAPTSAAPAAEPPAPADTSASALAPLAEPLRAITEHLAQQGDRLAQRAAVVAGALLLLTAITALHLLRTIRALGLWAGAVLLLSGLTLLGWPISAGQQAAPAGASALPPSIAALQVNFTQTVAQAVQQQINSPLQAWSIILAVAGAALLLAALYAIWRGSRAPAAAGLNPPA